MYSEWEAEKRDPDKKGSGNASGEKPKMKRRSATRSKPKLPSQGKGR